MKPELKQFIHTDVHASLKERTVVLGLALGAYLAGRLKLLDVTSFLRSHVEPFRETLGAAFVLVEHALLYSSLITAALSLIALAVLVRLKYLHLPSFTRNLRSALFYGCGCGLAVWVIGVVLTLSANKPLFEFTLWSVLGNCFSNLYEEICYRGLLFSAGLFVFRRVWAAMLFSSLIFALSHTLNPIMVLVAILVSVIFCIAYYRTGNLFAPWLAHQIADMV